MAPIPENSPVISNLRDYDTNTPFLCQLEGTTGPILMMEYMTVPEGQHEKIIEAWFEDFDVMSKQPGCIGAEIRRGTAGSDLLLNIAQWESTEAFRNAFKRPEFEKHFSKYPAEMKSYHHIFELAPILHPRKPAKPE